jgi:multicomponent K+:H+ antiporter subunit D
VIAQTPVLPVILPAAMAAVMVLGARGSLAAQRWLGALSVAAQGLLALGFLLAAPGGAQAYFLGDWPAPFGIVLVVDRLSAVMLALTAVLAGAVLWHAVAAGWDRRGEHFHALVQFQLMGLNGAFLTGDVFNLFVFFEVLLIASYGLALHGGGRARLRAGVQYVAVNLVASTLFLIALGVTYAVAGTLTMADLGARLALLPAGEASMIRVAAALMLVVFAVKGALVPLHLWLPATYAAAPGPVAALFAVMTKVGAYAVLRVFTAAFPAEAAAIGSLAGDLLHPAALATLAVGALGVLGSTAPARQAAFAAIASMGTLFLAVAAGTPAASGAALYYLLHSTLATALLFLLADRIEARREAGAAGPLPQAGWLGALFLAAAVALAGLPPLSGFLGKLMVLQALQGPWAGLDWAAILGASFLMVLGFARSGAALFWAPEGPAPQGPRDGPVLAAAGVPLAGLVALTLAAGPVTGYLQDTAAALHAPADYAAAVLARAGEGD